MTVIAFRLALVAGLLALPAAPALAQRRELQQMAADIRILQEQTQLLQNALTSLTEALKAVNVRIDEQTGVTRKTFADAKGGSVMTLAEIPDALVIPPEQPDTGEDADYERRLRDLSDQTGG